MPNPCACMLSNRVITLHSFSSNFSHNCASLQSVAGNQTTQSYFIACGITNRWVHLSALINVEKSISPRPGRMNELEMGKNRDFIYSQFIQSALAYCAVSEAKMNSSLNAYTTQLNGEYVRMCVCERSHWAYRILQTAHHPNVVHAATQEATIVATFFWLIFRVCICIVTEVIYNEMR